MCLQSTMTTSKSDLEAKEGQIPNESNFLEFVSLLGSLSTRAGGSSSQEDQDAEVKGETEAAEEADSPPAGRFCSRLAFTCTFYRLLYTFLVWICWQKI